MKCRKCGAEISGDPLFCPECGIIRPLNYDLNKETENREKHYCWNCGVPLENGRCSVCGREENDFVFRDLELEEYVVCPGCGKKISREDDFCFYCGAYLRDIDGKSTAKKAEFKMPVKKEPVTESKNESGSVSTPDPDAPNTTLWLILGIVSLVACCMPTSIGTIICSYQASKCVSSGRISEAKKKIKAAKTWFFVGLAVFLILEALVLVMNYL